MICKKCNVNMYSKTLCDDNVGILTCPTCYAQIYLKDEKMTAKQSLRDYHMFIFVDGNYEDSDNFSNHTRERIEETMRNFANEHYENFDTQFKIVLVDLQNNLSTIYEYQCEKTVNISCTVY